MDHYAGPYGYYTFDGMDGPSPDIIAEIGDVLCFEQEDISNWMNPIGFALYPDGHHGATWGGEPREELTDFNDAWYMKVGSGGDARSRRLAKPREWVSSDVSTEPVFLEKDVYMSEFTFPVEAYGEFGWSVMTYSACVRISQDLADRSIGGVLYYFNQQKAKMSGRIILISPATGEKVAGTGTEEVLEEPASEEGVDVNCGTHAISEYSAGGSKECEEQFLCGEPDTFSEFEIVCRP